MPFATLPLALAVVCGCRDAASLLPTPPSGGTAYAGDFSSFAENVEPILVAQGCDAGGDCHGGGIRGTFELSPPEDKDVRFDFDQVVLQVTAHDFAASPILTKPLAESAGGTPHAVAPFASTEDPEYEAILAWIHAGEVR